MIMCTKCKIEKARSEFGISKEKKNGCQSWCKQCKAEARVKRHRTPHGLVSGIYQGQIIRSKERGHHLPQYTRDELYDWCVSKDNFMKLFLDWKESGYNRKKSPSVDRLDDKEGYHFNNIRLVSFLENESKSHQSNKDGTGTRRSVGVIQYLKSGEAVREFRSVAEASRELGIVQQNIFKVLSGERKTAGGFVWKKIDINSGYNTTR